MGGSYSRKYLIQIDAPSSVFRVRSTSIFFLFPFRVRLLLFDLRWYNSLPGDSFRSLVLNFSRESPEELVKSQVHRGPRTSEVGSLGRTQKLLSFASLLWDLMVYLGGESSIAGL